MLSEISFLRFLTGYFVVNVESEQYRSPCPTTQTIVLNA